MMEAIEKQLALLGIGEGSIIKERF